jgi:hypothetical protein
MSNIRFTAGKEVVHAQDVMTVFKQSVTKMGAKEA